MNDHKILIGFVSDKYAVWYNHVNGCVYCEPLNFFMYGIYNVTTAYEKCKVVFTHFTIAE